MYGYGYGIWWIVGLIALALLVLFVVGIVVLGIWTSGRRTRSQEGGQGYPGRADEALEILRQRYARGEITREEFLAMREDLSG